MQTTTSANCAQKPHRAAKAWPCSARAAMNAAISANGNANTVWLMRMSRA